MRQYVFALALVAVSMTGARLHRSVARADTPRSGASRELAEIERADQADRQEFAKLKPEELRALAERDRARRERVLQIVATGQIQSADDYFRAALVLQHGDKPEEYLLAHELATVAGFKGHKNGRWLSAAALDRFLGSINRPQRFGTQYHRVEAGPWTQEPYDRCLPDAVRAEYGVSPIAAQAKRLEAMNGSKPQDQ